MRGPCRISNPPGTGKAQARCSKLRCDQQNATQATAKLPATMRVGRRAANTTANRRCRASVTPSVHEQPSRWHETPPKLQKNQQLGDVSGARTGAIMRPGFWSRATTWHNNLVPFFGTSNGPAKSQTNATKVRTAMATLFTMRAGKIATLRLRGTFPRQQHIHRSATEKQ